MSTNRKRTDRHEAGVRRGRVASLGVEPLEGRALLSMVPISASYSPPSNSPPAHVAMPSRHPQGPRASGVVTKVPRFYEAYTGPQLQELNAVKATGTYNSSSGTFTFTGTNRARITTSPAVYAWGIDRSGNLPPGPFKNRPDVKFDAVVGVTLDSSLTPTAKVIDFVSGKTTTLPAGSATVHGKTVSVTVPAGLLPSTGADPSQYRFNYWPEDGGPPASSSVASFAPEYTTAQVRSR